MGGKISYCPISIFLFFATNSNFITAKFSLSKKSNKEGKSDENPSSSEKNHRDFWPDWHMRI